MGVSVADPLASLKMEVLTNICSGTLGVAESLDRIGQRASAIEMKIIDPLNDPKWDRLAATHPERNFFHSSAWARVLSQTYGHQPFYLHLSQRSKLVALLPLMEVRSCLTGRRGVSLPFTDFCGPLVFGEMDAGRMWSEVSDFARERKWKYLELRGQGTAPKSASPSVTFRRHTLDLRDGPEELLAGTTGAVRRAIRKAGANGLRVQIKRGRDAMVEFYRLHCQTRRRHGIPPQPLSFFLNIHREVIEAGLGFVVVAELESRPVAAAVFFHLEKNAIYKFGASDETRQELRGNNLVMWEGIRFLAENGFESLDFGRTSLGNEGLRRFKLGWGTTEETIEYFKFDPAAGAWLTDRDKSSGFHTALFSRLPLTVNRLAGTLLYPHLD